MITLGLKKKIEHNARFPILDNVYLLASCVSELQLENAYPSISATLLSLTVDKLEAPWNAQ